MNAVDRSLPGTIGRYQVVRLLGQGAMGRVLQAHDPVLDRPVAVKLLRDDLGLAADQIEALSDRMRQEARASARVAHPHIVALHDMGDDADEGLFLVFEYVEGKNLKEKLEANGALGPEAAAKLAEALGDALTTAHTAGVLHRDVKPENVILAKSGAKVADFGIARLPDSTLTRDGGLLGTPAYAAPEAIASGSFSPLSDQFSMAATLYEAISGRRAFPGDDAVQVASRIATDEPPQIAELYGLDLHVDTVLARAMSKVPRSRFESCADFGLALAEALRMPARAQMPTAPDQRHQQEARAPGSRGARVAIGAAAAGALITVAGLQLGRGLETRASPTSGQSAASSVSATQLIRTPLSRTPPPEEAQPVAWLAELPPKKRRRPARRSTPTDAGPPPGDAAAPEATGGAAPAPTSPAASGSVPAVKIPRAP